MEGEAREDKQRARRPGTQKYCQTLQTNAAICEQSLCQNKLQTDRRRWITAVCLTMEDKVKTHTHADASTRQGDILAQYVNDFISPVLDRQRYT